MNITLKPVTRETVAYSMAGIAILLRMISDWIFAAGGPLPYQIVQATLLLLALIILWPHMDPVFLKGGDTRRAIREGFLALPLSILIGLGFAWMQKGEHQWPTLDQVVVIIANNLFFPAVEELEFRGFLLSWLTRKRVSPPLAVWSVAILHAFAHPHQLWQGDYLIFVGGLFLMGWFGWLTLRTRSLWGAYVAHASWNISFFLLLGAGMRR